MWDGLRDDIIMRLLLAQTNKAEQKVAISFTAFVSMQHFKYLILNLFLFLSTILSLSLPTIIINSNVKTLEGKERLLNVKSG